MEWPPGPYEYAMFALLLMTIPVQRLLTRDEVHMRVPLRGLLDEIRESKISLIEPKSIHYGTTEIKFQIQNQCFAHIQFIDISRKVVFLIY